MNRAGKVYIQNKYAGLIEETDEGYTFQYDAGYLEVSDAVSASITMPLRKEPYFNNVLFPFFDGLIPEGWLLGIVEKNWKISGKDRFGLLLAACRDCIGDVYIEAVE